MQFKFERNNERTKNPNSSFSIYDREAHLKRKKRGVLEELWKGWYLYFCYGPTVVEASLQWWKPCYATWTNNLQQNCVRILVSKQREFLRNGFYFWSPKCIRRLRTHWNKRPKEIVVKEKDSALATTQFFVLFSLFKVQNSYYHK